MYGIQTPTVEPFFLISGVVKERMGSDHAILTRMYAIILYPLYQFSIMMILSSFLIATFAGISK
jgi:hypothetical protein